jgi:hypothetical protein
MNIPAFTAEDAVYPSRTQYNVTARRYCQQHNLNNTLLVRNVVPQMRAMPFRYCNQECGFLDRVLTRRRWCQDLYCYTEDEGGGCDYGIPYPELCV